MTAAQKAEGQNGAQHIQTQSTSIHMSTSSLPDCKTTALHRERVREGVFDSLKTNTPKYRQTNIVRAQQNI